MAGRTPYGKFHRSRYEIEGMGFDNVSQIHGVLKRKGMDICEATVYDRLMKGVRTWEALGAPVKPQNQHAGKAGGAKRSARIKREKEEMAALMAALDERKKKLTEE